MTCTGCVASVREGLERIREVHSLHIELETGRVSLESDRVLTFEEISAALPDTYRLLEEPASGLNKDRVIPESEPGKAGAILRKFRQLKPLFLAFALIAVTSAALGYISPSRSYMLDFMGIFFLLFAGLKFLDYKNFPDSFAMYDPLAALWPAYGWVYPFVELLFGILLLSSLGLVFVLPAVVILLGVTTYGVLRSLQGKRPIRCACMGTALNLPMTEATLIENVLMIGMALISLYPLIT